MKITRKGGDHEKRFPGVGATTACARCDHPACVHSGQCRHPWEGGPTTVWCECEGFVSPYQGPLETLCLQCGRYQAEEACKCIGPYVEVPARPKPAPTRVAIAGLFGKGPAEPLSPKVQAMIEAQALRDTLIQFGGPHMKLHIEAAEAAQRRAEQRAVLEKHLEQVHGPRQEPVAGHDYGTSGYSRPMTSPTKEELQRSLERYAQEQQRNNPVPKRRSFQDYLEDTLSFTKDPNDPRFRRE